MIFARYKGPDTAGGGEFIPGKVYFGTPEIENVDLVGLDYVTIKDEGNRSIRVHPKQGYFEFLDEVYAVALEPFSEFDAGEVVELDGGYINGGIYVQVKGVGLWQADTVAILDRTNVYPGVTVMDNDGKWKPIMRADECLWLMLEGQDIMRVPTEFRFAVSHDKELMSVPLVTCLDATGSPELTQGRVYHLLACEKGDYRVKADNGLEIAYFSSRFRMG